MNMVSSLLLRVHQSGELEALAPELTALVAEGLAYYKRIRGHIPNALPFWPTGTPLMDHPWASFGIADGSRVWLAVWRFEGADDTLDVPFPAWRGRNVRTKLAYPEAFPGEGRWNAEAGAFAARLPARNTARVFELTLE